MNNKDVHRLKEQGNVLFLILIAVALFAALSYAVTQSTRSGSGSADKEKSLLSGASMTQYPTALRTSIIRMVLGGTDITDIAFDPPSGFGAVTDLRNAIFHPNGGGAVFQEAPADLMTGTDKGTWFFNANWDIPQIGIDGPGGNDVIAFLPGISQSICRQVNNEFSISSTGCTSTDGVIPDLDISMTETNVRDTYLDAEAFPVGDQDNLENAVCTVFSGQPSGCFRSSDNGGEYVFYSVLLER